MSRRPSRSEMDQAERKLRAARRIGNGPPRGKFWYSKKQRADLDRNGRPRFFFKRYADGSIVEYTELIEFVELRQAPGLFPADFDDAEYLGEGEFLMSA